MTKIEEHESELKMVTAKLEDVQAKIKALTQEEEVLVAGKRAWEAIVGMERKQLAGSEYVFTAPVASSAAPAKVAVQDYVEDFREYPDDLEEEGENKTQFVRDFMQKNIAYGVTANDLKAAAAKAGMKHAPSWPYGPIQRLKKKGEIVKRRGRFYPAPTNTQASRQNLALVS